MRIVIQRVASASVTVDDVMAGSIGTGVCLLVGVGHDDGAREAAAAAAKIGGLRIFPDEEGRMNRSLLDIAGEALVVSQFTLLADTRKGRRPSFTDAAAPDRAEPVIDAFCKALRDQGVTVATGVFGAKMSVELVNDGPVTIVMDIADGAVR